MTVERKEKDGSVILKMGAALSIYETAARRDEFITCLYNHNGLILEIDEVETCDAAGVQLLISARKTAIEEGKKFRIHKPSPVVLKTMKHMGLCPEALSNTEF